MRDTVEAIMDSAERRIRAMARRMERMATSVLMAAEAPLLSES